jgi:hypothetical protein
MNEVEKYIFALNHSLKNELNQLRSIIVFNYPNIEEHIKWNAPSYKIYNDDFLTFNLTKPNEIRLIFHRGTKVKAQPKEKLIQDKSGYLKWATNDRAVATFSSKEDIENQKEILILILSKWIKALE